MERRREGRRDRGGEEEGVREENEVEMREEGGRKEGGERGGRGDRGGEEKKEGWKKGQLLDIVSHLCTVLTLPLFSLPSFSHPSSFPLQVGNAVRMKRPNHGLYPLIGLHSRGEKVQHNHSLCTS